LGVLQLAVLVVEVVELPYMVVTVQVVQVEAEEVVDRVMMEEHQEQHAPEAVEGEDPLLEDQVIMVQEETGDQESLLLDT
jgi:hypothetical protein